MLRHKQGTAEISTSQPPHGPATINNVPAAEKLKTIIPGSARGVSRLDRAKSYPYSLKEDGYGKSVLDWQLSSLRYFELNDIVFIGGYHIEKIIQKYPNLKYFYNPDWQNSGSLQSLFCAESELQGRLLISYSNIVYRPEFVSEILSSVTDKHIAMVVDIKTDNAAYSLSNCPGVTVSNGLVRGITGNSDARKQDYDRGYFAGMFYFSGDGCRRLFRAYHEFRQKLKAGKNNGHASIRDADLTDLLSYMIDNGDPVEAISVSGGWTPVYDQKSLSRFVFGTKAQTLENLQSVLRSATILKQVRFSASQWEADPDGILSKIQREIDSEKVVIRSSALSEDSWNESMAGYFYSELDVETENRESLCKGIERVLESFSSNGHAVGGNQIFVQPYITGCRMSGVMLTRELECGAPYYVINYDESTGRTDQVTAGNGGELKAQIVYRSGGNKNRNHNICRLISLARELEDITYHDSLDIEFAINRRNECFLFQVRPLVTHQSSDRADDEDIDSEIKGAEEFIDGVMKRSPHLYGENTILADMPDWNPAEIIGSRPRPLALSLYQHLITDTVWGRSRAACGYRDTYPEPLVLSLAGKPYVDCRASFNSFIPASLPPELSERLVNHYLDTLRSNPELHDKVEFEIAFTCLGFDFEYRSERLIEDGFNQRDIDELRASLVRLTNTIVTENGMTIQKQLIQIKRLSERRELWRENARRGKTELARSMKYLLDDCREYGTFPFSNLARFAFAGTAFLKSLKAMNILKEQTYDQFLLSIPTVAGSLVESMKMVLSGEMEREEFIRRFGHLRPGTYDILSPRYDEAPDLYMAEDYGNEAGERGDLVDNHDFDMLPDDSMREIDRLLKECCIEISAEGLMDFIRRSIQAREYAKFEFTKNLSDALKYIGAYAEQINLTREEISYVPVYKFLALALNSPSGILSQELKRTAGRNRKRYEVCKAVQLPSIITRPDDIYDFSLNRNRPNFITSKKICAEVVKLGDNGTRSDLSGKIVLIENADPGYDWIFTRKIAGIITQYGGVASHMSIRAAEFGLPSAIGCGEIIFKSLMRASKIFLDCATGQIQMVET